MASSTEFDVIVVGAGVEGRATAYQLINNGAKRVLLLEQVYKFHFKQCTDRAAKWIFDS